MEKTTCLEVLKQGAYVWNIFPLDEGLPSACLSEANLGGADLRRVNLAQADLHLANLNGANLTGIEMLEGTPHLQRAAA